MQYLKSTIIRSFDPRKADEIFTASNKAPRWLNFMIGHGEWRSLIYHLSEQYPNCLVLNFAIQQISESGDYHNEIAAVSTAATSFRVFHRVLTDALNHLVSTDMDEVALMESSLLQDFKKMCCNTQYTYVYAQSVLMALIMRTYAADDHRQSMSISPASVRMRNKFIRLSEELEQYALKEEKGFVHEHLFLQICADVHSDLLTLYLNITNSSGVLIRKIKYLLLEYNFILKDKTVANASCLHEVTSALLPMLTSNTTTPGDVMKLHRLYTSPNPPPVEFLQHPDVFSTFYIASVLFCSLDHALQLY